MKNLKSDIKSLAALGKEKEIFFYHLMLILLKKKQTSLALIRNHMQGVGIQAIAPLVLAHILNNSRMNNRIRF
jgi:hypothetical protein